MRRHWAGKIDQLSRRELQVAERAAQSREQQADCDQLGLTEHMVKNYLFHGKNSECRIGSNSSSLLSKECNGSTADRAAVTLATEQGRPIETYLTAAEEGSVAAQFVVGLAHLDIAWKRAVFRRPSLANDIRLHTHSRYSKSGIPLIRCQSKV